jgi:hypothetical protein
MSLEVRHNNSSNNKKEKELGENNNWQRKEVSKKSVGGGGELEKIYIFSQRKSKTFPSLPSLFIFFAHLSFYIHARLPSPPFPLFSLRKEKERKYSEEKTVLAIWQRSRCAELLQSWAENPKIDWADIYRRRKKNERCIRHIQKVFVQQRRTNA